MAPYKSSKREVWEITIFSQKKLAQPDWDFVAELVSEEARKTSRWYSFILHDMLEGEHHCRLYVEASRPALRNLIAVMKSNLPYKVVVGERILKE